MIFVHPLSALLICFYNSIGINIVFRPEFPRVVAAASPVSFAPATPLISPQTALIQPVLIDGRDAELGERPVELVEPVELAASCKWQNAICGRRGAGKKRERKKKYGDAGAVPCKMRLKLKLEAQRLAPLWTHDDVKIFGRKKKRKEKKKKKWGGGGRGGEGGIELPDAE